MQTKIVVLKFEGTKTENEVYQVILKNLNQMIVAVGDNVELLEQLRIELSDKLALTTNRLYYTSRARRTIQDQVNDVLASNGNRPC